MIYYIPDMTLTEDGSYECSASVDTRDTFAELCGKYNIKCNDNGADNFFAPFCINMHTQKSVGRNGGVT